MSFEIWWNFWNIMKVWNTMSFENIIMKVLKYYNESHKMGMLIIYIYFSLVHCYVMCFITCVCDLIK